MLWRQSSNWPVSGWTRPFEELDRLRRQMDLLSGGLSRGLWGEPAAGVFPMMNITEDEKNYYVRAELPGIKADELEMRGRLQRDFGEMIDPLRSR